MLLRIYYKEEKELLKIKLQGSFHFHIHFAYDDFDCLSKVTKMDDTYQYKYNSNGGLVKILSNDAIIKCTYDTAKRLQEYRH